MTTPAQPQTNVALGDFEIALFVQREKHQLPDRHHEFIDDMVSRLERREHRPMLTSKQQEYLRSLFLKLGGKIT